MNHQLPNLPGPMRKSGQQISYDGADKAFCDMFSIEQMTAYGLQCAEAAVERERARCWEEVASMAANLRKATHPVSSQEHRDYAANLMEFVARQLKPKDAP